MCRRTRVAMVALVAAIASTAPVAAQQAAGSTWSPQEYQRYSYDEFVALPAVTAEIDFERLDYALLHAAVWYLTNQERTKRRLAPLGHLPALEAAAHGHSVDMRDRSFFSHTSPLRGKRTVGDRTRAAGVPTSYVGENIATSFGIAYQAGRGVYNPEQNGDYFSYEYRGDPIPAHSYLSAAQAVVTQWMNSQGHRENILRPQYRYLGVGAAHYRDASFYGMDKLYFTQNFAGELP